MIFLSQFDFLTDGSLHFSENTLHDSASFVVSAAIHVPKPCVSYKHWRRRSGKVRRTPRQWRVQGRFRQSYRLLSLLFRPAHVSVDPTVAVRITSD